MADRCSELGPIRTQLKYDYQISNIIKYQISNIKYHLKKYGWVIGTQFRAAICHLRAGSPPEINGGNGSLKNDYVSANLDLRIILFLSCISEILTKTRRICVGTYLYDITQIIFNKIYYIYVCTHNKISPLFCKQFDNGVSIALHRL